jgi:hypothetical protein
MLVEEPAVARQAVEEEVEVETIGVLEPTAEEEPAILRRAVMDKPMVLEVVEGTPPALVVQAYKEFVL